MQPKHLTAISNASNHYFLALICNVRTEHITAGERLNLMENTSGLDLVVGLLAFAILGGGLAMLFVGMASFPKEK